MREFIAYSVGFIVFRDNWFRKLISLGEHMGYKGEFHQKFAALESEKLERRIDDLARAYCQGVQSRCPQIIATQRPDKQKADEMRE